MDVNQYPFSRFKYINIPYPFYCIKPMITNTKKDMGKYSKRFAFILRPGFAWRSDSFSRTTRRNYLIKCIMSKVHLYFSKTGKEINKDSILNDVGKIVAGGVKL